MRDRSTPCHSPRIFLEDVYIKILTLLGNMSLNFIKETLVIYFLICNEKNNFAEISKNLIIDTDLKIILLDYHKIIGNS